MKAFLLGPLLFWALHWAIADDPHFPIKTKGSDPGISKFEAEWYGKSLELMNEPRLPDLAKDENAVAFRILILPTWGNPIAVRVQKQGETYRLAARRLDGQAGYEPGALVEAKDLELSIEDSRTLEALIQKVALFRMPTEDDVRGRDGDEWILEGVSQGEYHVVQRWCATRYDPDKRKLREFVSLFRFLLDKSTLSRRPSNKGHRLL